MKIDDGKGSGRQASVDSNNKLETTAVIADLQHFVSHVQNNNYQVNVDIAITSTEQVILLIKNTDDKDIILTHMRLEVIGAAAASAAAYFNINVGGGYASGGTAVVPTNTFVGAANIANGEFYSAAGTPIVTSGTFTQIDRTYLNSEHYNKNGALILPKNASLTVSHKGSTVAGQTYCRLSFYYDARNI